MAVSSIGLPPPHPGLRTPRLTFVGSLGDAHSLAYELVVSSPSTPAHATWASEATMLTCRMEDVVGAQELFVSLMLCHSQDIFRSLSPSLSTQAVSGASSTYSLNPGIS